MRDPDQAALRPDLGDRLARRPPGRHGPLEEQRR